jgi:hypothetical protein
VVHAFIVFVSGRAVRKSARKSAPTRNFQMLPFPESGPFDKGSTLLMIMASVISNKAMAEAYVLVITQVLKLSTIATPQTR